jgi:radical SAM protein with 4Fe4S-binding SPASM domain
MLPSAPEPARAPLPARALSEDDFARRRPVYVVWELTMKCDQPCGHCGSRAGHARPDELSTAEALDVAAAVARLGAREVTLIGGEAYLRADVCDIVSALSRAGVRVTMQTGGRGLTAERVHMLRDAGLAAVGVSIDGPARVHDQLRGNLGSHHAALAAMDRAAAAGLVISANTQVNRLNAHLLRETAADLMAHGAQGWQVQLTAPMGRAADRPEWILEPHRVVEVIDTLAAIQREAILRHTGGGAPFDVSAGSNLGYFGPHEQILRSSTAGLEAHYTGCNAGQVVLGIESDGTVKGCPSLPTAPYAGGNVRDLPLDVIWDRSPAVRFAVERTADELWGFCKTCYYADDCRGGCSFTAHTTLGRRGNNPFCYHRVVQLRRRGLRERLVPVERAPNQPYDFGRFELVEEPIADAG